MTSHLVRRPAFWIVLLMASGLCVFAVLHWFGDAFSVLDLDVKMSRSMAIDEARRLVADEKLIDKQPTEAAARFDGSSAQTFIELEGGGKPALKPLLGDGEFTLYKWLVRLFTPGVEREVVVAFTPDGRPDSFFSRIPEAAPGAALSSDDARAIALAAATKDWGVDFARYRPLTASSTIQPGKRVDHEFVYERLAEGAPAIGEGRLRLTMVVAGDRLTQLRRVIYVPEAFSRRYATLRSVNDNIAAGADVAAGLLYGLGGCLVGLIWLMRRHAVRWAPSAKWAAVVAALITAAGLTAVPGDWFGYDTATSASTYLAIRIGEALANGVFTWLALTVIFATAEGLSRLAFGHHPQLWRTWRQPSAHSRAIWGRTLAGYAWIGFDLAFIAIFYFVVDRYLGWWSPSDSLVDPNILGTPQPWVSPVSMALQAGMMEESLFRAIPIAGAALLGRHFGRSVGGEKTFIGIALVLQAIVFGCAHANYPGEPAYARPVELFLPALVWGIVYLRYGLVPGMLFHFGFDLVLMSIPLFVTEAPGIVFDRAMVIGILSLPIVVLAVQRRRAGRLIDLPPGERNDAPNVADATRAAGEEDVVEAVDRVLVSSVEAGGVAAEVSSHARPVALTRRHEIGLIVLALAGIVAMLVGHGRSYDAPKLTVSRDEAMKIAERAVTDKGVVLDGHWHRSVISVGSSDTEEARFLWREGGRDDYRRLVGNVLKPPHWEVRFARFDGDVARRESWRVTVVDDPSGHDGQVRSVDHDIPEAEEGKRLNETDARRIADQAIETQLHRSAGDLRRISADATERPARIDWSFVYADPAVEVPGGGEARIDVEVDGDQVVSVDRSLFVPEAKQRAARRREDRDRIPRALFACLVLALGIAILVVTVRQLARGAASLRGGLCIGAVVATIVLVANVLEFNAHQFAFTVAEPLGNQMFATCLRWAGAAVAAGVFATLFGAVGVRLASAAELAWPTMRRARQTWAIAAALALLVTGSIRLVVRLTRESAPRVPPTDAADSVSPLLSGFVSGFYFLLLFAIVLIAVTSMWPRARWRRWLMSLAVFGVFATMIAGIANVRPERVAAFAAILLVGVGLYRVYMRNRLWTIVPLLVCLAAFGAVPSLFEPTYPGSLGYTLARLVAIALSAVLWQRLVAADRSKNDRVVTATSDTSS